jgi:SSS family solute:Na+ symporter
MVSVLIWAAAKTKNYQKSVADFLVANRCAGRYLLGVSEGIASLGAITVIAMFEAYYKGGFSLIWWGVIYNLATVVIALSGWIVYRYRETRAMTLAQLLEMRYSKRFRIFAGILIFVSGTLNFGIFPAVGARFFQYFCGFPAINIQLGFISIDLVLAAIMIVLIGVALFFIFMGGQIVVMITEFIQGILFNVICCLILLFLIIKMPWTDMMSVLATCPKGQSMIHPFQAGQTQDFNVWFYLIQAFGIFYSIRAWQGNQGYFGAAINAHEARMGNIFGLWRTLTQQFMVFIIPIFAFVFLRHISFADTAMAVNDQLNTITNPSLQKQLTTTLILTKVLPVGLLGAFTVAMLCAFISNNDTYMHSWGSIFVQDIIMPLYGKHIDPKKQVKYLKISITGVAIFAFLFSLLFPQNDYVLMYFAMTGTLWLGGAGAVIIGGLYWKKGSVYGAYGALITGIVVAAINFILPRVWAARGMEFPINSQWLWFIAMIASSIVYVVLSLLHNKVYNINKLLHRGEYKINDDVTENEIHKQTIPFWQRITGIDENFNVLDKIIYLGIAGFITISGLLFAVITIYNLIIPVSETSWGKFWHFFIWISLTLSSVTTVWFFIGSMKDIKILIHRLTVGRKESKEDGTVK